MNDNKENKMDVGRDTIWGNPYPLGMVCKRCSVRHVDAGSTLLCFEKYARNKLKRNPDWLEPLIGKTLECPGCWKPGSYETCHRSILSKLIAEELDQMEECTTIIAGSRTTTWSQVKQAMASCPWSVTEVVCGMARGGDEGGLVWAYENMIPVIRMPADWDKHGRAAGHIRNEEMARVAQALVLVWDGRSRGSASMLKYAKQYGLRTHEVITE